MANKKQKREKIGSERLFAGVKIITKGPPSAKRVSYSYIKIN